MQILSFILSKDVTAEVRLSGGKIKPAHVDRLVKYLDLTKMAKTSDEQPFPPSANLSTP